MATEGKGEEGMMERFRPIPGTQPPEPVLPTDAVPEPQLPHGEENDNAHTPADRALPRAGPAGFPTPEKQQSMCSRSNGREMPVHTCELF